MSKIVVFMKNNNMLALLVSIIFAWFKIQATIAESSNPLAKAMHCLLMNKLCTNSSGFAKDTLVKTPIGYEKIQNLKPGSVVTTFDEVSECLREQTITTITTIFTTKSFCLTLNDEQNTKLYTGTKQKFYSYNPLAKFFNLTKHLWLSSLMLHRFGIIVGDTLVPIQNIRQVSTFTKLYLIEVANTHNFFVTKANILVHNSAAAAPWIARGIAAVSRALPAAIRAGKVLGAAVLGIKIAQKTKQEQTQPTTTAGRVEKIAEPQIAQPTTKSDEKKGAVLQAKNTKTAITKIRRKINPRVAKIMAGYRSHRKALPSTNKIRFYRTPRKPKTAPPIIKPKTNITPSSGGAPGGPNKPPKKTPKKTPAEVAQKPVIQPVEPPETMPSNKANANKLTIGQYISKGLTVAGLLSQIAGYTLKDAVITLQNWWYNAAPADKDAVIANLAKKLLIDGQNSARIETELNKYKQENSAIKKELSMLKQKQKNAQRDANI